MAIHAKTISHKMLDSEILKIKVKVLDEGKDIPNINILERPSNQIREPKFDLFGSNLMYDDDDDNDYENNFDDFQSYNP